MPTTTPVIADPFAAFNASVEAKPDNKMATPEWDGQVPPSIKAMVTRAVQDNVRVVIPCTDLPMSEQLRSAITTEVRREYPGKSAYIRDRLTDDKISAITFTVGEARRAKTKTT